MSLPSSVCRCWHTHTLAAATETDLCLFPLFLRSQSDAVQALLARLRGECRGEVRRALRADGLTTCVALDSFYTLRPPVHTASHPTLALVWLLISCSFTLQCHSVYNADIQRRYARCSKSMNRGNFVSPTIAQSCSTCSLRVLGGYVGMLYSSMTRQEVHRWESEMSGHWSKRPRNSPSSTQA